ncbi:HigA family addiction module antidote protein [Sandaracinobacteroides saxicola]|uniref:HigA family addiction module antidote protein n=2 Tax=Sandaracinobacteroides saxicola TaxID=2759707 RepID=A0A7G5IMS0_9SPHN|nr:HigA family addiction module antidote protein [Sandaracinobacteroides saxicola]
MSKLSTTTDQHIALEHPGEMLRAEFIAPLGLTIEALANAINLPVEQVEPVVAGKKRIEAELDLRLGRYFGMSAGFFLRMRDQYELTLARRALNGELDRIVPHAA